MDASNIFEQTFRALQIIYLFFYKEIICERHLSRLSGLEGNFEGHVNLLGTLDGIHPGW